MSEQTRYTLWRKTEDLDVDDEVLASGLTPTQAGKFIRAFDTQMTIPRVFDHGTFRGFELVLIRSKENHLRTVLAATVPKTADLEADRTLAMEMIDIQAFDRHGLFWDGQISTDADFKERLKRIEERRAVRKLDREITTKLIDALLADGYEITCCLLDDVPAFEQSKDRAGILNLLWDLEMAELHAHKGNETAWIKLIFGEAGWDVVADHTEDLAYLIDPIVGPHLPWNRPNPQDRHCGYHVFVLPSPAELERGDASAEKAFDDFVQTMDRIF
jgi:hypothetical protein